MEEVTQWEMCISSITLQEWGEICRGEIMGDRWENPPRQKDKETKEFMTRSEDGGVEDCAKAMR